MSWIWTHWVDIMAAYAAIHTLARIIVANTPSPNDDTALQKIDDVVNAIFGLKR